MMLRNLSFGEMNALSEDAQLSPRVRQHKNIHRTFADPCQRLLNAIGMESYIRPHRHLSDPKAETLVAVRGTFALIAFCARGTVREIQRFGTERYANDCVSCFGVEVGPDVWHTVVALKDHSVLLEVKAGPFEPAYAKDLAPWAPEEGSDNAMAYLQYLRGLAQNA